jgi:hypothetical protein
MMKEEFLKRWTKRATGGGAAEAFERDVEVLMRTTIRVSVSAIVNGLLEGAQKAPARKRETIEEIARAIPAATEGALRKLYE